MSRPAKYWVLWHGGSSYAVGGEHDLESFPSIAEIKRTMNRRANNYNWCTPCVSGDSCWVFNGPERPVNIDYPDFAIERGPNGGLQIIDC